MRLATAAVIACLIVPGLFVCVPVLGQTGDSGDQSPQGSISGKVTVLGKPVAGIKVVLVAVKGDVQFQPYDSARVVAHAKSGDDGAYSITGLSGGTYRIAPVSPTFILADQDSGFSRGKRILLGDGEQAAGVDLSLTPGSVITGKVVDQTKQPLIGEQVHFQALDDKGNAIALSAAQSANVTTDDRGVSRAYGLDPGRYRVSVGGTQGLMSAARRFDRTYAPGVTDASAARVIEVTSGSAAADVDIALGASSRTYTASGKFIDLDTGQAVPAFNFLVIRQQGGSGYSMIQGFTDNQGDFKLPTLSPGHYTVSISQTDPTTYMVESGEFDITDDDLAGLEIGLRQGTSISGTVIVDNAAGVAPVEGLGSIQLEAMVQSSSVQGIRMGRTVNVSPDGSFQISGLGAGSVYFSLRGNQGSSGFRLESVGLNGVDQANGIQVTSGQNVSGVTVVVSYGTGSIHGRINFSGAALPSGAWL